MVYLNRSPSAASFRSRGILVVFWLWFCLGFGESVLDPPVEVLERSASCVLSEGPGSSWGLSAPSVGPELHGLWWGGESLSVVSKRRGLDLELVRLLRESGRLSETSGRVSASIPRAAASSSAVKGERWGRKQDWDIERGQWETSGGNLTPGGEADVQRSSSWSSAGSRPGRSSALSSTLDPSIMSWPVEDEKLRKVKTTICLSTSFNTFNLLI